MNNIHIALNKISRNTGEDEYITIVSLEEMYDIRITSEEPLFRINNKIGIIIIQPFDQNYYEFLRNNLPFNFNYNLFDKIIDIKIFNKEIYIKYPIYINCLKVHNELFEDLKEEHGINFNDYTETEWEYLQNSDLWKRAEIQISREIIANSLLSELS